MKNILANDELELENLERKAREIRKKINDFKAMPQDQQLAEILHSNQCTSSHEDYCSWMYESWAKPGTAHNQYLEKAKNILKDFTFEQALKMLDKL